MRTSLEQYCEQHTSPLSSLLNDLERETYLKTEAPQMLSGPLQGQLLRFFSLLRRPQTILEVGTFTGYSALCLAEGLADGGTLHTIEAEPELEYLIRKYIGRAEMEDRIKLHIGRGEEVIPTLEGDFDLVFIDAGKQEYGLFYDLVIDRLSPGGLLLADNVLWSGKVLDPAGDADALALHAFNERIQKDERVENVMLPVRDGLMVMRRK
jgi:caffeoyl-CoA O-methyltransferase